MNRPDPAFAQLQMCDPLNEIELTPTDQHLPAQRTLDAILPAKSRLRERLRLGVIVGAVSAASLTAGASFRVGHDATAPCPDATSPSITVDVSPGAPGAR